MRHSDLRHALCLPLSFSRGSNGVRSPSSEVCPPEGAASSKGPEVAPSLEKCVFCVFFFLPGFPPPVLEIEESYPLAGTDVNVTCSGHVLTSPSPTLRLQGAPARPVPGDPTWLLLTATEEDDGRNFSCEASLEVQGRQLIKTSVAQLHVLCE